MHRLHTSRLRRRRAFVAVATTLLPCPAFAISYTVADTVTLGTGSANGIAASVQAGSDGTTARVWSPTGGNQNVSPSNGYSNLTIAATDGLHHAGSGYSYSTGRPHALLWNSTSTSVIDLQPTNLPGFVYSFAFGIAGNQQVGYISTANAETHAAIWSGTANSAIDLNPTDLAGYSISKGLATSGSQQVGWGLGSATDNHLHAMTWTGAASTAVDFNPVNLTGFSTSIITGTTGVQQVGRGLGPATANNYHALLWSNSPDSAVDLHPTNLTGFTSSHAVATNGATQAGYAQLAGSSNTHAIAWSGAANSAVDLNPLVSGGTVTSSSASSIDVYGNIAGQATVNGTQYAVVWYAGNVAKPAAGTSEWGSAGWVAGRPVTGNDALLISSDGLTRTINFPSVSTGSVTLNTLTIDATNAGVFTLAHQNLRLTTSSDTIGLVGSGAYYQTGGTHNVTGTLTLGLKPGSFGSYTLGGPAVLSAAAVQINHGSLTQQGGSYTSTTLANNGTFTKTAGAASLGTVTGTGTLSISGPATAASVVQGSLSVTSGTFTLMPSAGIPAASSLGSLTITPGASFDLTNNPLTLNYAGTSPVATIRQHLLAGRLTSSFADPTHRLAYTDSGSTVTVALALTGDANLDGKISPDDYALLDRASARALPDAHWSDGDFNYDGVIDASDYLLIDTTLGQAQGFSPGFLALRESQFGATYVSQLLPTLPEPTSLFAACGLAIPLLTRRRR